RRGHPSGRPGANPLRPDRRHHPDHVQRSRIGTPRDPDRRPCRMKRRSAARILTRELPRLARTARYLTVRQVVWRLWTSARFGAYGWAPAMAARGLRKPVRPAPAAPAVMAEWVARKYPDELSDRQRRLAAEAAAGRFSFLNRSVTFPGGKVDWRPAGASRLWQYHLHYGEYVPSLALAAQRDGPPQWIDRALALVGEWMEGNPPGTRPGWEPYPVSIRAGNWALLLGALAKSPAAQVHGERLVGLLAIHARFLLRHLEYHLGGNHLIKNAKALLIVSLL